MILMYHNLGEQAGFNTVSSFHFEAQMRWLLEHGKRVIHLDAYVDMVRAGTLPDDVLVITFDDAYCSFQTIALPLLHALKLPVTVYVPTKFVGASNVWDDGQIPVMDWTAIQTVSADPLVTIGSHGVAHKHMAQLSAQEIASEAEASKRTLEQALGHPIHHFSFPFGQLRDFDARCLQAVETAGYRSACSTIWGKRQSANRIYALNRLEIEPQDDLEKFSAKISRTLHQRLFRQRIKNLLFRLHLLR